MNTPETEKDVDEAVAAAKAIVDHVGDCIHTFNSFSAGSMLHYIRELYLELERKVARRRAAAKPVPLPDGGLVVDTSSFEFITKRQAEDDRIRQIAREELDKIKKEPIPVYMDGRGGLTPTKEPQSDQREHA